MLEMFNVTKSRGPFHTAKKNTAKDEKTAVEISEGEVVPFSE